MFAQLLSIQTKKLTQLVKIICSSIISLPENVVIKNEFVVIN